MRFLVRHSTVARALLAALTMSLCMAAQDNPSPDHKPKHHKYSLIDIGTLGGPASYNSAGGVGNLILNDHGTVAGYADTSAPDPYAPNCFDPDCYLAHTFRWDGGVITDLGALPGVNDSAQSGINDRGWVTGFSQNGVIDPLTGFPAVHAGLWKNRQILDLGTLGGYESLGIYVNNDGQVAGFATINATPDPYSFLGAPTHAFLWQNGVMQDLGTLGGPDSFVGAGGINQRDGFVVGGSYTNDIPNPVTGLPTMDPFLWKDGKMTDLGTLGGTLCCQAATVANNQGQVVGGSNLAGDLISHPFLWTKKAGIADLGTFGGDNGQATWINDAGDIVGEADLPGSQTHDAFLWRKGVMTDLGNLGATSFAYAINSQGQVVGASRIDATPGNSRAFLWEKGSPMVDLNTLIPAHSSLTLVVAFNINERGEIAGTGVPAGCAPSDSELCGHQYVLIPGGDCDQDNEDRIAESQQRIAAERAANAQYPATAQSADSPLTPIERIRSTMRQRYHLPGQPAAPRD